MTESQVIRQAADGDARAIRTLYDRYAPRVYAVVRRIAGDDELAQDYAQEAWIRAIRALPTFRGDARFSTWLHRIAVNAALQALRKSETRRKREAPAPEDVPVVPARGDALLQRRLERALAGPARRGCAGCSSSTTWRATRTRRSVTFLASRQARRSHSCSRHEGKMRELLRALDGAAQDIGEEAWGI